MSSFSRKWSKPLRSTSRGPYLGRDDVLVAYRCGAAAVANPGNAGDGSGAGSVQGYRLAPAPLAVHAYIAARLLNQAIRFARHHEGVARQTNVERLTGAGQRQVQLVGRSRRRCGNGDRTLEAGHRGPESLVHPEPLGQAPGDDRRNDLGVGCDLGHDGQVLGLAQIHVVVDVAVERRDHVRPEPSTGLLGVDRMGVGLGDDPDARPPGVTEHVTRAPGASMARMSSSSASIARRKARHRPRALRSRRPPCRRNSMPAPESHGAPGVKGISAPLEQCPLHIRSGFWSG